MPKSMTLVQFENRPRLVDSKLSSHPFESHSWSISKQTSRRDPPALVYTVQSLSTHILVFIHTQIHTAKPIRSTCTSPSATHPAQHQATKRLVLFTRYKSAHPGSHTRRPAPSLVIPSQGSPYLSKDHTLVRAAAAPRVSTAIRLRLPSFGVRILRGSPTGGACKWQGWGGSCARAGG